MVSISSSCNLWNCILIDVVRLFELFIGYPEMESTTFYGWIYALNEIWFECRRDVRGIYTLYSRIIKCQKWTNLPCSFDLGWKPSNNRIALSQNIYSCLRWNRPYLSTSSKQGSDSKSSTRDQSQFTEVHCLEWRQDPVCSSERISKRTYTLPNVKRHN